MWYIKYVVAPALFGALITQIFIHSINFASKPIILKTDKCAVFVYKNGTETDSYTAEVSVRKDYNSIVTVKENNITRVYFNMDGAK